MTISFPSRELSRDTLDALEGFPGISIPSETNKFLTEEALSVGGSGTISRVQLDSYRVQLDTTSITYQLYRSFTSASELPGTYRIGWTYEWTGSSTAAQVLVQIRLDTVVVDTIAVTPRQSTDRNSNGGFYYKVFASPGTHTVAIYLATGQAGKTATLYQSDIEFWRANV